MRDNMFAAQRRDVLIASVLGFVMLLGVAACSSSDAGESASGATPPETSASATTPATEPPSSTNERENTETANAETPTGDPTAQRPYDVFVPTGYDGAAPTPLVLLLHGYTSSGVDQEAYFKFEPLAESRGFLFVHPDGTVDARGEQFWNATNACCAFGSNPPDDVAYLMTIIEEVSAEYNVDPKAIFLAGHSNGGFMSYRMACEHAGTIAGVASLAGATFADTADCSPSEPVSVLQVHGTNDDVIAYDGGTIITDEYPGARQTVASWVEHNGCATTPAVTADALDLDEGLDGPESDAEVFSGCEAGAEVQLWTIDGGSHGPAVTADFSAGVIDFLLAHPKP